MEAPKHMVSRTTDQAQPLTPSARRRARFTAQRILWRESSLARVQRCGRRLADGVTDVQLRVTTGEDGARHGGVAGLQTCGSVWACPVCSAKVLSERQGEITRAVDNWRAQGGRVAFFTYTVRHNRSQSIDTIWDAISAAQHSITAGEAHQAEKAALGVEVSRETITDCSAKNCGKDNGYGRRHAAFCKIGTDRVKYVLPWVRVVEVTLGDAGWHVHQHMLVFLPGDTTTQERDDLYGVWWTRWADGARSAGVNGAEQVNHAEWIDADSSRVGDYFTKNTYTAGERAGLEVARADLKTARFGNRSAMQLLADVVSDRDPADLATWRAFEQGSRGRRQMTWAVGARVILGLTEEERTDEEIAAEETGTVRDTVAYISSGGWGMICAEPRRRADLIDAVERSTAEARALLDVWAVPWSEPDDDSVRRPDSR